MEQKQLNVGFDVGGVICPKHNDTADLDGNIRPNPKVVEIMEQHAAQGHNLFIISYCGKGRAFGTWDWLIYNDIVPRLVTPENVYFNGDDKRAKVILAKYLRLDMFYDDSIDVIESLRKNVPNDDKKRKKWPNLRGKIGPGPWGPLREFIPDWDSYIDNTGFGGAAVHWLNK